MPASRVGDRSDGPAEAGAASADVQEIVVQVAKHDAATNAKVCDSFYERWVRVTMLKLYDENQGDESQKGDDSSGSGRRSLLAESGRGCLVEHSTCRPGKDVSGAAVLAAAAAADDGQRDPVTLARLKVQDGRSRSCS